MNRQNTDVAIIGGGVGGIGAAIWCHRLGISSILLEKQTRLGGQLHWIHNEIPDYPGHIWESGEHLLRDLERQLQRFCYHPNLSALVKEIDRETGVVYTDSLQIKAKAIIIATGLKRRLLGQPWECKYADKGLIYTVAGQWGKFSGKKIVIIGGGDGAFENALQLSQRGANVVIVVRSDKPRARLQFKQQVDDDPHIAVHYLSQVKNVFGQQSIEQVEIVGPKGVWRETAHMLLVKTGFVPCGELIPEFTDKYGYLAANGEQRIAGNIWAVGDICTMVAPAIAVGVGQACIAARAIERFIHHD